MLESFIGAGALTVELFVLLFSTVLFRVDVAVVEVAVVREEGETLRLPLQL